MSKALKITLFVLLILGLVLVRMFEDSMFYDPLTSFFKTDHTTEALPKFETAKLLLHTAFRFLLNTLLSLAVLWVAFRNSEVIKLSLFLYAIAFILLFGLFWYFLATSEAGNHMALFYVRRFLIQPLFLLVLLPAFYFKRG
jgi:exosortase F-associated protein